ncbi:hypothetical protein [Brevibacillus fulvus]|uniref:Uncharacterized protein n=1 Tax=Brevibacillus fulvus TaxID=1125967 RepID=A0A938XX92_9BACL|nr:hypothetical protein [Brevibacillus fulvus]MBM7589571.1 hypothetical protein [Brevibacillus fulvus]
MKILSAAGETIPPGKLGSPQDSFTRSIATYERGGQIRTLTVTYPLYFEKLLAEQGIYDQQSDGVPVNQITAVLVLEQHPDFSESRFYLSDAAVFLQLFSGFSLADWKNRHAELVFT